MRFNPFRRRDDEGSIAIFMVTVLVTTGLVMITAKTVESGMRSSRRGGDSANALQVADAGVNDAVTAIQSAGGTTFTRTGTVGNGSYSYTATQDAANPENWLIDVEGTDQAGIRRRVRATASGEPLFASPMYVNTSFTANAGGVLDSYQSGQSLAGSGSYADGGCTDKGIMFFSPQATMTFQSNNGGGGGVSVNNCNKLRFGNTWDFSMDGCIVYGGALTLPNAAFGSGKCPNPNHATYPNRSKAITQEYNPPKITAPLRASTDYPTQSVPCPSTDPQCTAIAGTSFTCNASTGNNSLKAGKVYFYNSISLQRGCGIDLSTIPSTADPDWVAENPVEIYATSLTINTGTQGLINAPPVSSRSNICGTSTASWSYQDIRNNPAWYYCTGWVRSLSFNLLTDTTSTISISGNNGKFWGTFAAPKASVTLDAPNMEFWGAMLAGNLTVRNQFSWHYDDTLSQRTTGKYTIRNWREEPLS